MYIKFMSCHHFVVCIVVVMAKSCELLKEKLLESSLTKESVTILQQELVLDEHIFLSLQRVHIVSCCST